MRPIAAVCVAVVALSAQQASPLPSGPMVFGAFTGEFRADGTVAVGGQGWPTLAGTWKVDGARIELAVGPPAAPGCARVIW